MDNRWHRPPSLLGADLDEALAKLPQEVTPPEGAWAGLQAQLGPQDAPLTAGGAATAPATAPAPWRAGGWMVAGAAIAVCSALLTWGLLSQPAAPVAQVAATAPGPAALTAEDRALEVALGPEAAASLLQGRNALRPQYEAQLARLAPATRTVVENNLVILQRAQDDIRKALAKDPGNALLQQLLVRTWQQEMDLYRSVGGADAPGVTLL